MKKSEEIVNEFVNYHIKQNQTMLVEYLLNNENEEIGIENIENYYYQNEYEEEEEEEAEKTIYEWWLVSNCLLSKLNEKNEPILKTDYGSWWGRTCTGQSITMDSVIKEIICQTNKLN